LGISAPVSETVGGTPPSVRWIKAVADTGCTHTCVTPSIISSAGLRLRGKVKVGTPFQTIPAKIYVADLYLKYALNKTILEFAFRDKQITEFLNPAPNNDALIGMDILEIGTLIVNGPMQLATFCW